MTGRDPPWNDRFGRDGDDLGRTDAKIWPMANGVKRKFNQPPTVVR
jgi:hypothetical protein